MQATANEQTIRNIVQEVLTQLTSRGGVPAPKSSGSTGPDSRWGVFGTVDDAVAAAQKGFEKLSHASLEDRKKAISIVKQICDELHLQPRGADGEHSSTEGSSLFDISPLKRLGLTEVDCAKALHQGAVRLIALEKELRG